MQSFGKDAAELGIILNEYQLGQFDTYRRELLHWNEKTNLVSEKSSRDIIRRHFLDSLTALKFIDRTDAVIVDIGCGAGFPGVPLKIALPSLRLYLLETNRKKISFLKHIVRLLDLKETFTIHDRMENVLSLNTFKEKFAVVISRAAFKLSELLPAADFFLVPGGKLIALKGPNVDLEIEACKTDINRFQISQLIQHDIDIPTLGACRKIITGEKKYPRV